MDKNKEIDQILKAVEGRNLSIESEEKQLKKTVGDAEPSETLKTACEKRADKVRAFSLDVELDDFGPDPAITSDTHVLPLDADPKVECTLTKADKDAKEKKSKAGVCLKRVLYIVSILLLSILIAGFATSYLMDAVGINKSDDPIDVEIPQGSSTQQIADILVEKGAIDNALYFRIYSRLTKADGKYQLGTFTLSADMGYTGIVNVLQTATPRANVTVTIPEGYTVEQIAELLEDNGVCKEEEFFDAVVNGDFDYDFIKVISSDEQREGRIYQLEGYLFPDTYNFYENSSGEAVVERMLQNFDNKINENVREKMSTANLTIDETIILASLIQGEAAKPEDMKGVSRVLFNRMESGSGYAKLELDSTRDYVQGILPSIEGIEVTGSAYNTYVREGLPVGAINNPGMEAIEAVFSPSEAPEIINCYFFATDYDTGITYFNETFAQHEHTCRKYGIGAYG